MRRLVYLTIATALLFGVPIPHASNPGSTMIEMQLCGPIGECPSGMQCHFGICAYTGCQPG